MTVVSGAETGGQLTFVGTDPDVTIPLRASGPRAAAQEAVARFGPSFGLAAGSALRPTAVDRLADGRATVHLQQEVGGVPVIGGELIVNLDPDGDLLSIGGELEPEPGIDSTPAVGEARAAETAIAAVAKKYRLPGDELQVGRGELWIFDSRILGGPGLEVPRPVWRFEAVGESERRPIRELVLVDARLGSLALSFSEIDEAKFRWVCDAAFAEAHYPICFFADAARVEGAAAVGIAEVDLAYDLSGDVYDFYSSHLGRDSIDGSGMAIVSDVRYCGDESCPVYENALWNGAQMTFGPGWVTDDILGHELTHGVVEHESGLYYYYQSGAINESLADTVGELFDLSNGLDPPGDRWLMSEDSPGGAIRDMANPPSFGDPDRMGSANWYFDPLTSTESGDAGGVHTNSGVGNKAAYLLTDGGSFNGRNIVGLGTDKVMQIYNEVNANLLGSAGDYADLANALPQACSNLSGEHGIVPADCDQVRNVVLATEMDQSPPAGDAPAEAATCGPSQSPVPVFSDDLENPLSGNWETSVAVGANAFSYPGNRYATSGTTNIWAFDGEEVSDSAIEMTKNVTVPGDGLMRFNHAYGFESAEEASYDGGVIEYSIDGGASWHDAGDMIVAGETYTDTLAGISGNPLGGRRAFAGDSAGYGSTRLDLSSLAGQQVRFRFRFGSDESVGDYGWFIDDVEIYRCVDAAPPAPPTDGGAFVVGDASVGAAGLPPTLAAGDGMACQVFRMRLARARVGLRKARRVLRVKMEDDRKAKGQGGHGTREIRQRVRKRRREVRAALNAVRGAC